MLTAINNVTFVDEHRHDIVVTEHSEGTAELTPTSVSSAVPRLPPKGGRKFLPDLSRAKVSVFVPSPSGALK